MKTLAKVFFVCVACLSANLFIGCSEDPITDNTPKRVIPKKGSTYTYIRKEKDNSGTLIAGTDTIHTVTSQADFAAFSGKDSTISFVDVNTMNSSASADTMTIAYEGNGDISIYRGLGLEGLPPVITLPIPTWWRLPFKSKANITLIDTTVDLSFSFNGVDVTIKKIKGIATAYSATSNYVVNDKTYVCDQTDVTFTVSVTATLFGIPQNVDLTFKTTYLFNEELGYFVSFDTQNNLGLAASFFDPDNNIQVLTSFDVKK